MAALSTAKSVAQLEGKTWPNPGPEASHFHRRCYEAATKPISSLNADDLRLLISQDIGLMVAMPLALGILQADLLVKTEHFKGDLLVAVLGASQAFYREHAEIRSRVNKLLDGLTSELEKLDHIDFDTTSEALEEALSDFKIHRR